MVGGAGNHRYVRNLIRKGTPQTQLTVNRAEVDGDPGKLAEKSRAQRRRYGFRQDGNLFQRLFGWFMTALMLCIGLSIVSILVIEMVSRIFRFFSDGPSS